MSMRCEYCGALFANKWSLKKHIESAKMCRKNRPRFVCTYCNYVARDNYNLNRHFSSKKCGQNANRHIAFNFENISESLRVYLTENHLLEGEEGIARCVYTYILAPFGKSTLYKVVDSSRCKCAYISVDGTWYTDLNCSKLKQYCQQGVNKKIEEYWEFFEALPYSLKEKVLENKELGKIFTKTLVELLT